MWAASNWSTTPTSCIGEDRLDGFLGPLVKHPVGVRRSFEREAVADQRCERHLTEEVSCHFGPAGHRPGWPDARIDMGNLRADDANPVAMEAAAQVQAHRLLAVPGRCHNRSLKADGID